MEGVTERTPETEPLDDPSRHGVHANAVGAARFAGIERPCGTAAEHR